MPQNFQEIKKWIFLYEKEIFIGLLVIFSSTLAYGLGRLTKLQENQPPVTITQAGTTTTKRFKLLTKRYLVIQELSLLKMGRNIIFPGVEVVRQ